jgi:hypothetical protein
LGSGGAPDVNEYNWSLSGLTNGWNEISLNISDASVTGGTPDLGAVNWFRIYHSKNGSATTRIDGIALINSGTSSKSSNNLKDTFTLSTEDISLETGNAFTVKSYPNPFSVETTLAYQLTEPSRVNIDIYNIYGQKVVSLATNEQQSAGGHSKVWNPTNLGNVSSGIYLCIIQISNVNTSAVETHKLNFMR